MYKVKGIYDGSDFKLQQPTPVNESYEVIITFFEPLNVSLSPYNEDWISQFQTTKDSIANILGDNIADIYHIGSTSIKGVIAKPIIDVAVAVKNMQLLNVIGMEIAEYYYCGEREPGRYLFVKQQSNSASNTHHIHCFLENDKKLKNMVLFSRYLNEFPEYAKRYSDLKLELTAKHPDDRFSYSAGKGKFIEMVIDLATNRYAR